MEDLSVIQSDIVLDRNLFIRIGDLLHIEGPLLTLFQDQKDARLYLYDWMDSDNRVNRWIVYGISPESVLDYVRKEITHMELFSRAENVAYYFADIDPCNLNDYKIKKLKSLPTNYSQTEDNFFDEEYSKDAEKILLFVSRLKATEENANFYDLNMAASFSAASAFGFDTSGEVVDSLQAHFDQSRNFRSLLEKHDAADAWPRKNLEVNHIRGEVLLAMIRIGSKVVKGEQGEMQVGRSSQSNVLDSAEVGMAFLKQNG
jgi:hypothetical protein